MQKKSPLYVLLKEDTVWSMERLNRYINDNFRKTKGLPRDWVFTTFTVSSSPNLHLGGRPLGVCGVGAVFPSGLDWAQGVWTIWAQGCVCTTECVSMHHGGGHWRCGGVSVSLPHHSVSYSHQPCVKVPISPHLCQRVF